MVRYLSVSLTFLMITLSARSQTELQWKWKPNDVFYVDTVTESDQKMTLLNAEESTGRDRKTSLQFVQRVVMQYRFIEKQDDGTLKFTQTLLQATVENLPKNSVVEAEKKKVREDQRLRGVSLTLYVKDNKVVRVEGYDDLLKRLAPGKEEEKKVQWMMQVMSNKAVSKSVTELFGLLPNKTVKKGDKWSTTTTSDLGPLGKIEVKHDYEMGGPTFMFFSDWGSRVNVTSKLVKHESAGEDAPLFAVIKSKLQAEGSGQVYFNPQDSRITLIYRNLNVKGTLTLRNDIKQRRNVDIVQNQKVKIMISEQNPLIIPRKETPEQ